MTWHNKKWNARVLSCLLLQIVEAKDVVRSTGKAISIGSSREGSVSARTYHIRCLPFGIARTELTGPLPFGKRKVRSALRTPLWRLNSSTVPLRRPA